MGKLAAIFVVILSFTACTPTTNDAGRQAGGSPIVQSPSPSPAHTPKNIPPQTFNGKSQAVTPKFTLEGGLSIFRMKHQGTANWAPKLLDSEGNPVELLANEIGKFDGAKAVQVEAGEYVIDVTANGAWEIVAEQPRPIEAPPLPAALSGSGQTVSAFFFAKRGLTRFQMNHAGDANWAPKLLNADGDPIELLANEIGKFEGEKAVRIPLDDIYVIDVTANGAWTINVTT